MPEYPHLPPVGKTVKAFLSPKFPMDKYIANLSSHAKYKADLYKSMTKIKVKNLKPLIFLKNHHLRMVVDGKGFISQTYSSIFAKRLEWTRRGFTI